MIMPDLNEFKDFENDFKELLCVYKEVKTNAK
jgi:hypothetical protein